MQAVWAAERMKDYLKNESWVIVCRKRELQTRKVLQADHYGSGYFQYVESKAYCNNKFPPSGINGLVMMY
jgi:hypothetical protein